jgi:hypothetical protein
MLNRTEWTSSRYLSQALKNAQSVTIEEYAGTTTIGRKVLTAAEIGQLLSATSIWFCDLEAKAFLCFEPHHRVEIVRANGSQLNLAVCFLCKKVLVTKEPFKEGDLFLYGTLPSSWEKSLTSFFTSVGMTPKTGDEYGEIEEPGSKARNEAALAARLEGRAH